MRQSTLLAATDAYASGQQGSNAGRKLMQMIFGCSETDVSYAST
jgi:hypothetical protein